MPTRAERIEKGIYCAHWIDNVIMAEIVNVGQSIESLANEDGVQHYVLVIDGTQVKRIPIDLRAYVRAVSSREIAVCVLNAPWSGEVMGRMVANLITIPIEYFRERNEWIQRAQELLNNHSSKTNS